MTSLIITKLNLISISENEIGKLFEFLVIGLTSKTLDQQWELVADSAINFSNAISKSSDNFERLANESEDHMLRIVKGMDDIPIQAKLWKPKKLRHASGRLEDILYEEELRKEKIR